MFVQFLLDFSKQKVRFAQILAFSEVAKIEGEVFVALGASQGNLEPSRAAISPQLPCSLTPGPMDTFCCLICPVNMLIHVHVYCIVFVYMYFCKYWIMLTNRR